MKDKKKILLVIGALLSVVLITVGVSFAFFNYVKQGTTENSVTTGTITFLYTEVDKVGAGIKLENAIPITDTAGKMLTGSNNVFNFKVTSTNKMNASIPFEVTARMKADSTLDKDVVKVYLTKGETEEEVLLDKYSNLTQTERVNENIAVEKTIYNGRVPSNTSNYEENFKLRMWIDSETDFSGTQDEEGNTVYPYNNKTFTLTVNVYADAKVVSQEEIDMDNSAKIENITAGDTKLTEVTGQNYNYELTLPEGTTSTTLNIETENPKSTVEIEKVDSLATNDTKSNIVRLSTAKTVSLVNGENYFKVKVISPNKVVEKEYGVKILVETKNYLNQMILDNNTLITAKPTLTTYFSNTSDKSGLYKSTATNSGKPTYYFRGNVTNNYVSFAGLSWRIVRINEDGTIRLILSNIITIDSSSRFTPTSSASDYRTMYYSYNPGLKPKLETWYDTNITKKGYGSKVATGEYFCEQAKVAPSKYFVSKSKADMIVMETYNKNPNFKCSKDANGYGLLNASVALITYDELLHAGSVGSGVTLQTSFYLKIGGDQIWTMSPAGYEDYDGEIWIFEGAGDMYWDAADYSWALRPVINLKADVEWASGTGSSGSPYKIK